MIKQECIGIPDMILLLMIFCFKKIKIKAEIVLSPGGAYFGKAFSEHRGGSRWVFSVLLFVRFLKRPEHILKTSHLGAPT